MKMGMMQGRLSPPVGSHMQEFPESWKDEFALLEECGLWSIEWLITKGRNSDNPILRDAGLVSKYPISSVCVDTLVDKRIFDFKYLHSALAPLCALIDKHFSVRTITIPLLEESSMVDKLARKEFASHIVRLGEAFPNINFSFEAELGIEELREIISLCDNFYVTYDTGNITSYGIDHEEYIRAFSASINNVHLKDRTFSAETVEPTKGDTDFGKIFESLERIGYNGPYILQTARSIDGEEKNTIMRHKKIFENIYAEAV